jgi:hypothetical protein
MPLLEEVYRLSGVPTHTFVEPLRYQEIKIAIRTPGRCVVIEGPSGIGKTTTVKKVLAELNYAKGDVTELSARIEGDIEYIELLPEMNDFGTVIIDDFHRLSDIIKVRLSDIMKILADSEDKKSKLILIGINKSGQLLVNYAHDLALRIDVFKLEANPEEKIIDAIERGEQALNISISDKRQIAARAQGSFQIAQLLCHRACASSGLGETVEGAPRSLTIPLDEIVEEVMVDLGRLYKDTMLAFARGSKLRREGRAPYLHILRWLSESNEWSLDLREALKQNTDHKASVGQVLDKGFLASMLEDGDKKSLFEPYFHFEPSTCILSVEDPKVIFYLKNLIWREFTRQVGFPASLFKGKYDFALSFAGPDRDLAKDLYDGLTEREISVFYDENEQHRILATRVEEYLGPIYRRDADYVVALLSKDYPNRIWTKFESGIFRERFGQNAVVPIRFRDTQPGFFSEEAEYGGLSFDPNGERGAQVESIIETLSQRLLVDRLEQVVAPAYIETVDRREIE